MVRFLVNILSGKVLVAAESGVVKTVLKNWKVDIHVATLPSVPEQFFHRFTRGFK